MGAIRQVQISADGSPARWTSQADEIRANSGPAIVNGPWKQFTSGISIDSFVRFAFLPETSTSCNSVLRSLPTLTTIRLRQDNCVPMARD
jgi:hypothetical protein